MAFLQYSNSSQQIISISIKIHFPEKEKIQPDLASSPRGTAIEQKCKFYIMLMFYMFTKALLD